MKQSGETGNDTSLSGDGFRFIEVDPDQVRSNHDRRDDINPPRLRPKCSYVEFELEENESNWQLLEDWRKAGVLDDEYEEHAMNRNPDYQTRKERQALGLLEGGLFDARENPLRKVQVS